MSDDTWKALGLAAPARRALMAAGFRGPADLVGVSAEQLLALHGIGRTAIVILAPYLESQQPLYSVEREYAQPMERLWHAWTDAAALESWYHGMEHRVVPGSVTCEPEIGGRWAVGIDVVGHGFVAYFYGRYLDVVPMSRLEHTLMYTETADGFAARDESVESHRVVIDLESRGDRTWVRYSQFGELPEGEVERARAGMESYFDSLEAFLSSPSSHR